ncbi:MAG: sulfurtransferase [Cycloclasticus sp. symbiont of Poecilosclerida sp. M]|nr:MAG: sulfurtransferase [Cycloclasticus sp. symbiont of Poecilosclerida sp. M]
MDLYLEFITRHSLLFIALVVILVLLLQTVYSDLMRKHKLLTTPEAIRLINREDAVIIDTRNSSEFKAGHITDAINVSLPDISEQAEKLRKYGVRPLVFYCKLGPRGDEACKTLTKLGFTNIYNLSGGLQAWQDANMPLVKK